MTEDKSGWTLENASKLFREQRQKMRGMSGAYRVKNEPCDISPAHREVEVTRDGKLVWSAIMFPEDAENLSVALRLFNDQSP